MDYAPRRAFRAAVPRIVFACMSLLIFPMTRRIASLTFFTSLDGRARSSFGGFDGFGCLVMVRPSVYRLAPLWDAGASGLVRAFRTGDGVVSLSGHCC